MKLGHALISAALLFALAVLAQPASAFENEDAVPAAFVEGTRDYSIPYLEKTLVKLQAHFSEEELQGLVFGIAALKSNNAYLLDRIAKLRAKNNSLKENDPDLVHYRKNLALTTKVMFDLLQKLNERTALPSR